MFLGKFPPRDVQPGGLQLPDLLAGRGEGQQRIKLAVGDEQPLRFGDGREVADQFLNLEHPAADADDAGETVRLAQAGFDGHEAALRKSAERNLVGWKVFRAQIIEQFKQ